jgi:hypothetical protein
VHGIPVKGYSKNDKRELAKFFRGSYEGVLDQRDADVWISYGKFSLYPEQQSDPLDDFIRDRQLVTKLHHVGLYSESLIKTILTEYILLNRVPLFKYKGIDFCVDGRGAIEDDIAISFSPYLGRDELIDQIKRNWKDINKLRAISIKERAKGKVKPWKNFVRDVQIYNELKRLRKENARNKKRSLPEVTLESTLKKRGKPLAEGSIRDIEHKVSTAIKRANSTDEKMEELIGLL